MPFAVRTLVSAVAALFGVLATYAVADGRGIGPWVLIFLVGLGVGFGTRGGWLAGLVGERWSFSPARFSASSDC